MESAALVWVYMFSSLTVIAVCYFLVVGMNEPNDTGFKPIFSSVLAVLFCVGIYIVWTYICPIIATHLHLK